MDTNQSMAPAPRIRLNVDIEFRRSYARQAESAIMQNISITGAYLTLPTGNEHLMPNDKVVLTFNVSGRERKINASVIWKGKMGCGIQFHPFNNRDVQIVDDLMYFVENSKETRRTVLDTILKKVS